MMINNQEHMRIKDVVRYLSMSVSTLYRWRKNGTGPRFTKIKGIIWYCQKDIDNFMQKTSTRSWL